MRITDEILGVKGLKETSSGKTSFIESMMKMSQIIKIDFKKIGKQIQGKLKLGFPPRYHIGLYDMTQLPLLPSEKSSFVHTSSEGIMQRMGETIIHTTSQSDNTPRIPVRKRAICSSIKYYIMTTNFNLKIILENLTTVCSTMRFL